MDFDSTITVFLGIFFSLVTLFAVSIVFWWFFKIVRYSFGSLFRSIIRLR